MTKSVLPPTVAPNANGNVVTVRDQTAFEAAITAGDIPAIRQSKVSGGYRSRPPQGTEVRIMDGGELENASEITLVLKNNAIVRMAYNCDIQMSADSRVESPSDCRITCFDRAKVINANTCKITAYASTEVEAVGSTVRSFDHAVVKVLYDGGKVIAKGQSTVFLSPGAGYRLTKIIATSQVKVITPEYPTDLDSYIEYYGLKRSKTRLQVYKAVRNNQYSSHKALYEVGKTTTASDWNPAAYCGYGLHFAHTTESARRYDDQSRRYFVCSIPLSDCVLIDPGTPGIKIKAKSCRVLYEVDINGERIKNDNPSS